ncbi:DUF4124 domain-containing protein [Marinobacter maroccanus]|uniref:DUF4124 domain-containing protein n=1 Tax=Marinobacter maroccanus TaxID=2055143 RepID=A0A2S5Z5L5_9GAMM|nr:DUF4124 domain-containing protein [Marinobacter maroccanus]PPI82669.1 DUF4124 domain-containing protein [Marinobacter maroccanus]
MPRMLAGLVLSFFLASVANAEVYTWIDSRGVAHFSDYPPGEIPHKQLQVQAPVTVPMSENLKQGKRVSGIREDVEGLLASGRPGGSGISAKEKADARLEKTCATYRSKLERIQSKLRAGYSNDRGNTLRQQRRTLSQKLSRECILR